MKKSVLKKYADLIVNKGVAVARGEEVVIVAELDQPEFVTLVVQAAYKAGASKVTVEWGHQPLEKLHVRYQTQRTLSRVEPWEVSKMERRAAVLPSMIYLISEDPDGLNGINYKKMAIGARARRQVFKPIRDKMENKYKWVIAAVPGRAWAKKLFPKERAAKAEELLWSYILKTSRADGDDPSAAWDAHNDDLSSRCAYLNSLNLSSLHITSKNGTDLKVGLIPRAVFMGGAETTMGSDVLYNPNIPSEEVFITPMKGKAEGIVYSSKPFSYNGKVIEHFYVRFEGGRAVEIKAEDEETTEILKEMIAMDEGASYLGEVALVPFSSPVNKTELLFFNTLFDENAACHLALGRGFSNCLENYESYTFEETKQLGINDSIIHEDFMIGTADTLIVGYDENGKSYTLFKDGEWAF